MKLILIIWKVLRKNTAGYTLIELMIVISIISILSTGVMIGSKNLYSSYKLKVVINRVLSEFRKARQLAISKQMEYGIRFNLNNTYTLFSEKESIQTINLDSRVEYAEVAFGGDREVIFKPLGTADNGHLTLTNTRGEEYELIVSSLGRIRLEKID